MNSHALFATATPCNLNIQQRRSINSQFSPISNSQFQFSPIPNTQFQISPTPNSQFQFSPISNSQLRRVSAITQAPLPSSRNISCRGFSTGPSLNVAKGVVKKTRIGKAEATNARASAAEPEKRKCGGNGHGAVCQKARIGGYFTVWWGLNVVFNVYNKKVLNVFPFPWLTSTLSLAAGSAIMLASWALKLVDAPDVDCDFLKRLAPVAIAHTIGHVAATISMSKVAVSFTHIIKSAEPAFSVLIQRLVFGEHFPLTVYLALLPIIGGCALAAATELHFNTIGFAGAMISNVAFVFRNIFSKRGMSDKSKNIGGMNYYACLSMMSLAFLLPFAFAIEGPKAWAVGWTTASLVYGNNQLLWWVVAQSVFYHLYNQVSYMSLDEISPLTFSVGNTIKRVTVIVSSILIFHTKILPINVVGAAIAILGTFLYSQIKQ